MACFNALSAAMFQEFPVKREYETDGHNPSACAASALSRRAMEL
jgi:hypothetical protein